MLITLRMLIVRTSWTLVGCDEDEQNFHLSIAIDQPEDEDIELGWDLIASIGVSNPACPLSLFICLCPLPVSTQSTERWLAALWMMWKKKRQ